MVRYHIAPGIIGALIFICMSAYPQSIRQSTDALSPRWIETGQPFIQNFSPKEYDAHNQNWAIVQDLRGVMYFGNESGVLEYDGVSWRLIPVANKSVIRSLAVANTGRVYVGAQREFGYLAADSIGQMHYISLLEYLKEEDRDFSDVWEIYSTSKGIYFKTNERVFCWSNNYFKIWKPEDRFHTSFVVRDTFYVRQWGVGLMRMEGDSLRLLPDGEQFANERIYVMLPYDPRRILIGTRTKGFFLYDGSTFLPFKTDPAVSRFFQKHNLYHGANLPNGTFALAASLSGGVAIIDRQGRLLQILNQSAGLRHESVNFVYQTDKEMWLALDNGLAKVETASPLTIFKDNIEKNGIIYSMLRHRDDLYLATGYGIQYFDARQNAFRVIPGTNTQCWQLLSANGQLLAATSDGVFRIYNKQASYIRKSLTRDYNAHSLLHSRRYPNLVYVGINGGLALLRFTNGKWGDKGFIPGIKEKIISIAEAADGWLWLSTQSEGVLRVKWTIPVAALTDNRFNRKNQPVVQRFGTKNGLPNGAVMVSEIAGKIYFATSEGLLQFQEQTASFLHDSTFAGISFGGYSDDYVLVEDAHGKVWINWGRESAVAFPQADGSYQLKITPFLRFADFDVNTIYPEAVPKGTASKGASGVTWFGGSDGLIRYDANIEKKYDLDFPALIRRVTVNEDSLIYDGAFDTDTLRGMRRLAPTAYGIPKLAYTANSLRFEYAATSYEDPSRNRYQIFLEGFDKHWSQWTSEHQKDYTNLPAGKYRFRVRAKNVYDYLSSEAVYEFTIVSPWYQTGWAYAIYILLVLALLYGIRLFELKRQKRKHDIELAKQHEVAERLRQVDKLKDEFLANTSHELRTPLNGIIGIAESLMDGVTGVLSKKTIRNLSLVVASGKRLANLVNDILDFSKLKTHNLELCIKPVDLSVLVDLVLQFSESLIGGKNLVLKNNIPRDMTAVLADENRLQQILHNLIGNAIKFTESGTITVSARQDDHNIEVSVSDTGVGIPVEKQAAIFRSFEQADASTEREFGGTGLGLSISRQLVELHDGQIWVTSEPEKGSTFTFTLPVSHQKPESADSEPLQQLKPLQQPSLDNGNNFINPPQLSNGNSAFRILIVDDEPVNQQVLANHLSFVNYHITQAFNGAEALKLLENGQSFDLILLDIMMPKMSGYEVCQKIRKRFLPSELPVIMITAKNQVADLVEGLSSGANDYLAKPISKNELLARVKTHLNLYHINTAYGRFVPQEFLRTLGRDSILDVKLGDQMEGEMTIWFSDIRAFTALSENLTPKQNFDFLNEYLSNLIPVIRQNRGFIDKYIGDAVMALFPNKPEDALIASIEALHKIEEYNQNRVKNGKPAVHLGIGLHTGGLMLGTIGDKFRMDGTVISDAVNLASRLEGLTKKYGATLVISEDTFSDIPNPDQYNYRFLAKVKVMGKKQPTAVYEFFSGDNETQRLLKQETLYAFGEGIKYYFDRNFAEAVVAFKKVLNKNPHDKAASIYLESAAKYVVHGVTDTWQGIDTMESK